MDFEALVKTRRSVRGFKAEPVPRAVIEEIIEVAKRALIGAAEPSKREIQTEPGPNRSKGPSRYSREGAGRRASP
jgi:nitroreductase